MQTNITLALVKKQIINAFITNFKEQPFKAVLFFYTYENTSAKSYL